MISFNDLTVQVSSVVVEVIVDPVFVFNPRSPEDPKDHQGIGYGDIDDREFGERSSCSFDKRERVSPQFQWSEAQEHGFLGIKSEESDPRLWP